MNIREFQENGFFCFTKTDPPLPQDHLYGFGIIDNKLLYNRDLGLTVKPQSIPDCVGNFIVVSANNSAVSLLPDFNGFMPLFLYEQDDWWAVSNSFLLLEKALRKAGRKLTLNFGYASCWLHHIYTPMLYDQTVCKEIRLVHFASWLRIDLATGKITENPYPKIESADIMSASGMELIDRWIDKYAGILRAFSKAGWPIMQELTGGFDSRICFGLMEAANVDLSAANIRCDEQNDDRERAEGIAEHRGFKLNANGVPMNLARKQDADLIFRLNRYGFHPYPMTSHRVARFPYLRITGYHGKILMEDASFILWPEEYVAHWYKGQYGAELAEAARDEFLSAHDRIMADFYAGERKYAQVALDEMYAQSRARLHNGSAMNLLFMKNAITLAPIADPLLYSVRIEDSPSLDLLYGVIMNRLCHSTRFLPFNKGRSLDPTGLELGQWLNRKYPRKRDRDEREPEVAYPTEPLNDAPQSAEEYDPLAISVELFEAVKEKFFSRFPEEIFRDNASQPSRIANLRECAIAIAAFMD